MECYYHPDREGNNTCAICGKSVCEECSLEIAGKMYCKECLEKIVGIGLDNKTDTPQEETEPVKQDPIVQNEPVRLDKKVDNNIYQPPQEETPSESYYQAPQEEFNLNTENFGENVAKKPISEDSPYNIREMGKSNEIKQQPKTYFKKEATDYLEQQPNNINQEPEYYEAPKQMQQPPSAQNEFDYYPQEQIAPQQEPAQEYIYPDHEYKPGKTSARQALEDKYEKYLDDLYFDEENEIPLEQQLAKDEEEYGSLTRKPYTPQEPTLENEGYNQQINSFEQPQEQYKQNEYAQNRYQQADNNYAPQQNYSQNPYGQQNMNQYYTQEEKVAPQGQYIPYPEKQAGIREQKRQKDKKGIHDIKYEDEKEPIGIVDIILTIILIIAILIVIFYIVYLFFLSSQYPTFIDAIFGIMG